VPRGEAPEPPAVPAATPRQSCGARDGESADYTLEVGGIAYPVAVHVPAGLGVDEVAPVVLTWHGVGGTGAIHAEATGYTDLADREGFIVVSPTGPPIGDAGTNGWELPEFEAAGRDDVAFAESLIDDVVTRFCGDRARIYSIGMSNGGLFTSRLVCQLGARLAAAAAVGGLIHSDDCSPARAVPFIAFHGTADDVVPFDGTATVSEFDHPITAAFAGAVMPDEFAQFAADMGCEPEPEVVEIPPDVLRYDYLGCTDGVQVTFHEVVGGGHTWPGPNLWDSTNTVDATAGSWAFFEQYTLGP
jgi:polyhydroxybutyrate depolymerase